MSAHPKNDWNFVFVVYVTAKMRNSYHKRKVS